MSEPSRSPRGEKVPDAESTISANANTSGVTVQRRFRSPVRRRAFGMAGPDGQGSDGFGMAGPDGQGSDGFGMAGPDGQGSDGFGMAGPDGQGSDGFGIVRNGDSPWVRYIPPLYYTPNLWEKRGLGYRPEPSDSRDYQVWDEHEKEHLDQFCDRLDAARKERETFPAGRTSPFKSEFLRHAFDLCAFLAQDEPVEPEFEEDESVLKEKDVESEKKKADRRAEVAQYKKEVADRKMRKKGLASKYKAFLAQNPSINLGDTGYLSAVEDQDGIASCTAQAVVGLAEYLLKAGSYQTHDLSRLFLYKATRDLMGESGDSGAYIRDTIKAMSTFGVPPEKWWAYTPACLDCTPPAPPYILAQGFKAITYRRIDSYGLATENVLQILLYMLAAGFPVAFGFSVYQTISEANHQPYVIPIPTPSDKHVGNHAVLAVGYDTEIECIAWDRRRRLFKLEKGALIIKNSWGEGWGDRGFAYLPFHYVLEGLALDFWTIFNPAWIDVKPFAKSEGA